MRNSFILSQIHGVGWLSAWLVTGTDISDTIHPFIVKICCFRNDHSVTIVTFLHAIHSYMSQLLANHILKASWGSSYCKVALSNAVKKQKTYWSISPSRCCCSSSTWRLVVQCLAAPFFMPKYPWARDWTPSCSPMCSSACECVWMLEGKHLGSKSIEKVIVWMDVNVWKRHKTFWVLEYSRKTLYKNQSIYHFQSCNYDLNIQFDLPYIGKICDMLMLTHD